MMRVLTSLILIPLITWIVLFAPPAAFTLAVGLFASLCWFEYAGIARHYGSPAGPLPGWLPGLAVLLAPEGEMLLVVCLLLAAMAVSLRSEDLKNAVPAAALFLLGIVYSFGVWRSAFALHEANAYWLLFALTINWVGDSAAYYVGRAIGRHKLAPVISPGKSWEGAVASIVGAALFSIFFLPWAIPGVTIGQAILAAVAGNVAGQLGDLAESALKRGAGVKDSGTLLPGHGGWLDRLDSSLFSMPVIHLLLPWLVVPLGS